MPYRIVGEMFQQFIQLGTMDIGVVHQNDMFSSLNGQSGVFPYLFKVMRFRSHSCIQAQMHTRQYQL